MKKVVKKSIVLLLVVLTIAFSACGTKIGLIKAETNEAGTMTAHLFSRKVESGVEYCLTLLEKDEPLDMAAEPNIHKSSYEFDYEWNEDMLGVIQNDEEEPIADILEIGGVTVVFGQLVNIEQ